jgi:hypothetical protein
MRAALYVPQHREIDRIIRHLTEVAQGRGWTVEHVVWRWPDLVRVCADGAADVGLVTSRSVLPAGRLPRLVAADELVRWRPRWAA